MNSYYGPDTTWLILLLLHLVMAVALWKMAERVKEEPKWFAIVPILNVVLLLRLSRKPLWWLILFFLPIVNIITLILVTMSLCERFNINKWWGLVVVLSPFNLVLFLYLAFGAKGAVSAAPPTSPLPPAAPQA